MRKLVLITAVVLAFVLASASAQAGESRSLSTYPVNDTTSAVPSQPVATKSLRADNDTPATQPAETPRYSPPPGEAASNLRRHQRKRRTTPLVPRLSTIRRGLQGRRRPRKLRAATIHRVATLRLVAPGAA